MDVDNNDAAAAFGTRPGGRARAPPNDPDAIQFMVRHQPQLKWSDGPTTYERYIHEISEHSPKKFVIDITALLRRPNLVHKMVNFLGANSSVTKLDVRSTGDDYTPSEEAEASVIAPILSVIRERPQTRTLDFSRFLDGDHHQSMLFERILYEANQNPSIYEFHLPKFMPFVEYLSPLSHNERKRLTLHLSLFTVLHSRRSLQDLTNAVANNSTIERFEFFDVKANYTLAVLEGLRENLNVKELGLSLSRGAFRTPLGDVLRNNKLEHLRLRDSSFIETEDFQVIADYVNNSTTLMQLSLEGRSCFGAGSAELLKALQVTSLGMGRVVISYINYLQFNYDWTQCFDQMFGTASSIKKLSLFANMETTQAVHILSLLAKWPGETLSIELSSENVRTRDIINALATHLPSTSSIKNFILSIPDGYSLTPAAMTLLLQALESNSSIEHLQIDCSLNSISDDDRKRLQKYPALNRQLRSCRDTGKLVGAATEDSVGAESGEPVGAEAGEHVGAENADPNEKLWPLLFQAAGSSSTGAASTIRKNEVFEAVREFLPRHAQSQIAKKQDETANRVKQSVVVEPEGGDV